MLKKTAYYYSVLDGHSHTHMHTYHLHIILCLLLRSSSILTIDMFSFITCFSYLYINCILLLIFRLLWTQYLPPKYNFVSSLKIFINLDMFFLSLHASVICILIAYCYYVLDGQWTYAVTYHPYI